MDEYIKNDALAYIIKYIEKTGERIVYSKGLPLDNFVCWDEGEYIGEVSADVIKRMRKCN